MTKKPTLLEAREDCVGCSACYAICPASAIEMKPDKEGFLYPVIGDACIGCLMCLRCCPLKERVA